MRIPTNVRTRLAAAFSALTLLAVAGSVHAQFAAPTCTPPNCNPAVIQNVDISATAQTASINISGSQKLGGSFQTGALAPVLTAASDNLMYGNVGGTSTNGSLLLLQFGAADRLRVLLTGQMQLPIGSAAAPSYSFLTDTNTGLYSSVADSMSFATNGVARTTINNTGTTINSGVLAVPSGTNAAPSITFTGDTNTGIFRGTADTINFVTNGVTGLTVSATNNVVIPGALTVNGTFTSSGGVGGDGSNLTNLNATNITTGTLNDTRLSTNVTTYTGGGTFTGVNNFSNASNSFTGSGAGLTSLNASNISSGTLADGRLSSNVALYNANGTFTGNNGFTGMTSYGSPTLVVGAGQNMVYGVQDVTSAGNLMLLQTESAGVYTDRFRVSGTGAVTATSFAGNGSGLTALNASNLSSGTVPSARISGTYSNALTFSGANSYTNQSTFGSASLVVAAGQNLLYGNMDATSAGSLLLLQNESVDRFRVDAAGNVTAAGNISAGGTITATGGLTVGGQNVCVQDGTNCPPTLNGGGTTDYITKFTGSGNTVGDSMIYEDSANGRIGIGTTTPGRKFEVRNGDIGTYSGNIAASFGSVSGYVVANGGVGISGQAVGISTYGAVGSGDTGVAGYGENYGGWFTAADNFGGAAVYAQWTGNAGSLGKAFQAYTDRPAATAAYIEATDATNASTRGLYVSTPYTVGALALTVIGDSYFSHDIWVNDLARFSELGSDPAGATEGRLAYVNNKFRCNEGGTWVNCGGLGGSGTTNYLPKFTSASALGNSIMSESGGAISVAGNMTITGSGSYGLYVQGTPSWGIYSTNPIEANGTTFAVQGTAGGGAGGVHGTATGAGIVYGVVGNTTVTTDVNSAGVYGSGRNGVFGYSNMAGGTGVKASGFTNATYGLNASISGAGDAGTSGGNTFGVIASNNATGNQTNAGINAGSTGANAGTNIAAYLNASGGANNYALVTVGGYVGFGEQSPLNPVVIGNDGSAALPALSIGAGDDSNTGFFRPNADTIALSTAGVERVRVSSLGNVGIANTVPGYPLDVTGTARFTSGIGTGGLNPSTTYGIQAQGSTMGGYMYDADGTSYTYLAYSNYGLYTPYAGYFGGKLGVGTSAPYADYLALGNGLGHNKFTLYETSAAYSYGMGVVSGQLSFHIANNLARFAFYTDAAATTEVFTIWGNGDIVAPYNQNGAGSGWIQCGQNGGYCYCPNGSFVGVVYHESNTNLAQALQVYCYKP